MFVCFLSQEEPKRMDVKSAFLYETIKEEVYVDDIIFGSTNKDLCKAFERLMKDKFQMSSMGELTFFLALEDITYSDDKEDVGVEADFTDLETTITVSPILTTRVHKDHLVTQIIDDLSSTTQTRNMTRVVKDKINGGYVSFGRNPKGGKIIGKGKIWTDTECIVLSLEFKLPDENKVLLRVPRENNMYNVNLKNIVSSGDLTCLFAKATLDESNLWHKRLDHINFKIMNKLVKGNLVKGLPSKVFENNHTCVACKKGKQHRASCKTKPVSFVSQPLQRVLVTKPHNNTPYELLLGRTPSIGFMRPFGCLVTILNTLDPLGKFDGKADKGFLVGYSVSSKTFRVINSRTRIVQETLHINFLENKPNVAGSGPTWLFDIDTLTKSMNYQPVTAGEENVQQYVLFPLWSSCSKDPQNTDDDATFEVKEPEFEVEKP
nr:ribonuclease H-like domain-containing protein [Tanacetum cinerariifolium]